MASFPESTIDTQGSKGPSPHWVTLPGGQRVPCALPGLPWGNNFLPIFQIKKKKAETPRSWNLHLLPSTILLLLPRTQHGGGAAEIQRRASCITRLFSSKGCEHPLSPFTNPGNERWESGKDVFKKKVFSQGISQYNYIVRTPN